MIIVLALLIPIINIGIKALFLVSGIFVLMRMCSAYVQKAPLNLNTIMYVGFLPELITGPYRDYAMWSKPKLSINNFTIKALNYFLFNLFLILAAGYMYSFLKEFSQYLMIKSVLLYIVLFLQFSAACNMVSVISGMFGQPYIENFNKPYTARNISDFWARWHISLGSFVKTYLNQPITFILIKRGFSRNVAFILSILITYIFIGTWHNVSNDYFLFGLYFAALIVFERLILDKYSGENRLFSKKTSYLLGIMYAQSAHIVGLSIVYNQVEAILIVK